MGDSAVSVIVPVYKVEKYISRCIDSILNQTFADFELLLVDDGSLDNSGKICDEYAKKDNRIKVFHKNNGGPSSTRNYGIEHATGKWIAFVDSDDYIGEDYLSLFFQYNSLGDIYTQVIQGFHSVGDDGEESDYPEASYRYAEVVSGKYNKELELQRLLHRWAIWGRIFSTEIINRNNIRFDERIHVFEDGIFWHQYILNVEKMVFIPEKEYYYFRPKFHQSITTTRKQDINEVFYITCYYNKLSDLLVNRFCLKKYAKDIISLYIVRYRYLLLHVEVKDERFIEKLSSIRPNEFKYAKGVFLFLFILINRVPLKCLLKFRDFFRKTLK